VSRTLVLASRSPRRRELLQEACRSSPEFEGIQLRIEPPRCDEPPAAPAESPESYTLRLARLKARAVAERLAEELSPGDLVLGADTVVDLDGDIIGQPATEADARRTLARLSGRRQAVVTAVVIVDAEGAPLAEAAERTELEMLPMSYGEIARYVESGESLGHAGAYAIQETGDRYVRVVSGSRSNVVGLPMERLAEMLRAI